MANKNNKKQYRLHSLLKLHNRILEDHLKKHALVLLELRDLTQNLHYSDKLEVKEILYDAITSTTKCFAYIGKAHSEVIIMANALNSQSTQEDLAELYKKITSREVDNNIESFLEPKVKSATNNSGKKTKEEEDEAITKVIDEIIDVIIKSQSKN